MFFDDVEKNTTSHMGQFSQDGENGQSVAFFWHLVLAHLEPELELFEVDGIGDYGDDDL